MCGIAGIFNKSLFNGEDLSPIIEHMLDALAHRGPDDLGVWKDQSQGVWLGHLRLAILDLSPEGHQPMLSYSQRYVLIFNGEIYNHIALRNALGPRQWRGHSDTETILSAIETWGVEAAVKRFVGMFAFALWDRERKTLWLGRDRLGIKPLYYGFTTDGLLFASELKALQMHPAFEGKICRDALHYLLRYNSIPAPHTIYEGVFKVMPGTLLRIRAPKSEAIDKVVFWSVADVAQQGQQRPFMGTPEEAVNQLEVHLKDAVRDRMLADVPLGAFLSGGVDSSTVVALMQAQSERPVQTFSIGARDADLDEAPYARAVAQHLGTDHTELYVSSDEALDVVPKLATMYNEPFADASQIPTFIVSQLARRSVTVALSGDGGDELFGGYNRHVWAERVWRLIEVVPSPLLGAFSRGLKEVAPSTWDTWFQRVAPVLPKVMQHRSYGYKLHKLANGLEAKSRLELYHRLSSQWMTPSELVLGGNEVPLALSGLDHLPNFQAKMMLLDMQRYLPDDILTKVDRASMAVSLEARVPLLDHRVVEFAWRLPLALKLRDGLSKWVLRQVLYRYVPKQLIERPKAGFEIPLAEWLRNALRPWAEELLDGQRLREEGFFNPVPIRTAWAQHIAGTHNWAHQLWTVLMFQSWLEQQGNQIPIEVG